VFRMHSTDGTSGGYYMSPHKNSFFFSHFIALVHMHSVLLDVCNTNIQFPFFLPSSTHVRGLSLFLLYTSLLSPDDLSWPQVFKQLCKLNSSCSVIEISSFYGSN
jgi:hypothetical protein